MADSSAPRASPPTLRERTEAFNRAMLEKKQLRQPKSERIQRPGIRAVVADLEKDPVLESFRRRHATGEFHVKPFQEPGWKESSVLQTIAEVPRFGGHTTGTSSVAADPETVLRTLDERRVRGRAGADSLDDAIREAAKKVSDAAPEELGKLLHELHLEDHLAMMRTVGAMGAAAAGAASRAGGGGGGGRAAGGGGLGRSGSPGASRTTGSAGLGVTFAGSEARSISPLGRGVSLRATYGSAVLSTTELDAPLHGADLGRTTVGLGGDPAATALRRSMPPTSMGMSLITRTTMKPVGSVKEVEDGYGGFGGASLDRGRWLSHVETREKLARIHRPLPFTPAVKHASGKYAGPADGGIGAIRRARETFVPLRELPGGPAFDAYLRESVRPDQLLVVACLRNDESHCRRTEQLLQMVNGTLARLYPLSDDFRERVWSDPVERARRAEEAALLRAVGVGDDRSQSPFVLGKYDMALGRQLVVRYKIFSLPFFLVFFNARLVYRGVMSGSAVVRVPAANRPVNSLVLEPDARHQPALERTLRGARVSTVLATGTYDAARDAMVGAVNEGVRRVEDLAKSALEAQRRAAGGAGRAPGSDATSQVPDDFALVFLSSSLADTADLPRLLAVLRRSPTDGGSGGGSGGGAGGAGGGGGGGGGGGSGSRGGTGPMLRGRTLVVSMLPTGSVLPGAHPAPPFRGSSASAAAPGAGGVVEEPWVCPRTGIVQNPRLEHLLGGAASVAVVRPLKPAGVEALVAMWRTLLHERGERSNLARSAAVTKKASSASSVPGLIPGDTGDGDGVHLGLTHNDLLERMHALIGDARSGRFVDEKELGDAVLLMSSETAVRGVELGGKPDRSR